MSILHTPMPNQPFILHTDASNTGIGAVLAQETTQGKRPIFYLSKKLTPTEKKYAIIEKEVLVMRWAIGQLKYSLW